MANDRDVGFQSLFEEVVRAKRLSSSKMQKLQEVAMKNMENDTQMVSIMFRTHKTLSPTGKISSLYAFDALARSAREAIDKKKVVADPTSTTGNCATFLLKLEGILESLIQDLISSNAPEPKEKTKKILDIWTKHRTFPASVLTRLTSIATETKAKDTIKPPTPPSTDPRVPTASTTPPMLLPNAASTAAPIPSSVQSALLALLGQTLPNVSAVLPPNTNNVVTPPAPAPADQLEAAQRALLQQLAQQAIVAPAAAAAAAATSYASGVAVSQQRRAQGVHPGNGIPSFPTQQTSSNGNGWTGPSNSGSQGWDDSIAYNGRRRSDEPSGSRPWRGRGRAAYGGSRDSPPPRHHRSRSRSPPYHQRRDPHPHSPPSRPYRGDFAGKIEKSETVMEKDEFGRDIRPHSPVGSGTASMPSSVLSDNTHPNESKLADTLSSHIRPNSTPVQPQIERQTQTQPEQSKPITTIHTDSPIPSVLSQGLDGFDFAKFDATSSAAWDALGKAWQVTNGKMPTQEQLMTFVMSGGAMQPLAMQESNPSSGYSNEQWQMGSGPPSRGRGRGRGRGGGFRGRGRGYGGYMNENDGWGYSGGYSNSQSSDAVVLGESGDTDEYYGQNTNSSENNDYPNNPGMSPASVSHQNYSVNSEEPSTEAVAAPLSPRSSGGKMQRVGDRWIWQPAGS